MAPFVAFSSSFFLFLLSFLPLLTQHTTAFLTNNVHGQWQQDPRCMDRNKCQYRAKDTHSATTFPTTTMSMNSNSFLESSPNFQTYIAESSNMKYLNSNLEEMNFNVQESMKKGQNVGTENIQARQGQSERNTKEIMAQLQVEEDLIAANRASAVANLPDPRWAAGAAVVFLIVSTIQQLSLGDVFDDEAKASVDASAARRMSGRNRSFFKRPRGEE